MFSLGQIIMTARISTELENNKQFLKDVKTSFTRYQNCDWGEISKEDKELNQNAIRNKKSRIFAAYETCKGKIWIITELNRNYTSVLFPSEDHTNKNVAFPHEQKDNETTNK